MSSVVTAGVTTVVSPLVEIVRPDVSVGQAEGKIGFFEAPPVVQPTSASVTDYASLKVALQNLGLIGS